MALSKFVESYPEDFLFIAEHGWSAPAPFKVEVASSKEAKALQMRWYAFLRALDADAKDEKGVPHPETGHLMYPRAGIARNARKMTVKVRDNVLIFAPRDLIPESLYAGNLADDLRRVLAEGEPEPPEEVKKWYEEGRLSRKTGELIGDDSSDV